MTFKFVLYCNILLLQYAIIKYMTITHLAFIKVKKINDFRNSVLKTISSVTSFKYVVPFGNTLDLFVYYQQCLYGNYLSNLRIFRNYFDSNNQHRYGFENKTPHCDQNI